MDSAIIISSVSETVQNWQIAYTADDDSWMYVVGMSVLRITYFLLNLFSSYFHCIWYSCCHKTPNQSNHHYAISMAALKQSYLNPVKGCNIHSTDGIKIIDAIKPANDVYATMYISYTMVSPRNISNCSVLAHDITIWSKGFLILSKLKTSLYARSYGFDFWQGRIRHSVANRCDVSSEQRCLSAKPWRWALLLVTRYGWISRV